ncbi:MAG: hypothetical protein DBX42_03205 [Azospirillum sp.]|nr:MAG: hypothetical protein DBX42_03205 [Azospirillum sp.]
MERPSYLKWLIEEKGVTLDNGESIQCYKLDYVKDDETLNAWAIHIRRHYISDEELDESCEELEISPEEYLKQFVIPQKGKDRMAGTARSNGISEILFSDLLEFIYGLEVPRCRMDNMSGPTVSEHGTDVIGYKYYNADKSPDIKDRLVTVEVKAGLTQKTTQVIEKAVIDANKDEYRIAQSLDYMRKKLKRMNKQAEAEDILRFQKKTKYDYQLENYAAGMSSLEEIPEQKVDGNEMKIIPEIVGEDLRLKGDAGIYYVHGKSLMELAHNIYDRCVR